MPDQAVAPGPGSLIFMFGPVFLIFYFLVFRPQAKERKAHKAMLSGLNKHDEVVTSGGLIGTVTIVKPDTITLKIDENVKVSIERSAISRVIKSRSQDAAVPAVKS